MKRLGLFLVAVLICWLGLYASGICPWIGGASLARKSIGVGMVGFGGEDRKGTEWGFDTFLFFAGQEVVIDYDLERTSGSLWLHVFRPYDSDLDDGVSRYVVDSGHGVWTVPITKTGIYHITVDASSIHGHGIGWDIRYSAKWGARPMRAVAG